MSTSTTTHPTLMPAVDVYQGPDDVRLVADLPGASAEAVHVAVEGRVLSLEAATTAGTAGPITYRRKFNLGPELDPTGVRAEVSDGVLSVTLPRLEPAGPRSIEVQAG